MGTKSFVDVYEQMINRHNKKAMSSNEVQKNINDYTDVIRQDDDQEEQEEEQDDEALTLSDDDGDDQEVQDEEQELESDDQDEDFDLDLGDDQLDKEPQSQENPEDLNPQNQVAFNFPDALLAEFANTLNQTTVLCANIVKSKSVTQKQRQDFNDLIGKVKNLFQAAQKSVQ